MNDVQVLMVASAAMFLLFLGCLAFMRKNGALTGAGLMWSIFFAAGGIAGLYLIITG